jgi:N6-L-threonylcarbamoyladenine synthase
MQSVILAIESSCDETSASVVRNGKVLNNIIASQAVHRKYGGVVPELASRAHQQNIVMVVHEALEKAMIKPKDLSAIAFTRGPGLMGSLLVGVSFAKGLALGLNVPLIEVNHMQAHVLAHFIDKPTPVFPFLCLTVSGGHTQIVLVRDYLDMEVIGETRDDAAGEAFDKGAKMLGLPYPGGPLIDKYAAEGNPRAFTFPVTSVPGLDFSFSGIKTSLLYLLRDGIAKDPAFVENHLADLCSSLQFSLVKMLLDKVKLAMEQTSISQIAIAGGVSANSGLQNALKRLGEERGWRVFIPDFQYCTDNAGMIAIAAHFKYLKHDFTTLDVTPMARMPI